MQYYDQSTSEVLNHFQVKIDKGLGRTAIKEKQQEYGYNTLQITGEYLSRFSVFVKQWKSPLLLILLVAGTISGLFGEFLDMILIYVTAFINSFIGFFQEDKANQALKKLQSLVEYKAIVIRDGKKQKIESTEIVPGDIIFVFPGDKIQADGRLLEVKNLHVNEAPLTGESEPIKKTNKVLGKDVRIGERTNMLFRGTAIAEGEGTMVVTATGMDTEIGKIASLVQSTREDETPLQMQLAKLGKFISIVVVLIAIFIFAVGFFMNNGQNSILHLFETSVAVAVAAIPEGLVISLTVILAIGMQFVFKRNALLRRLIAAETLGAVSVICTDKTGTLTEGNMRLSRIISSAENISIDILREHKKTLSREITRALEISALCNNVIVEDGEMTEKNWKFIGDTTEVALMHAVKISRLSFEELEQKYKRRKDLPFSSKTKYMATLCENNENFIFVKGAPEVILLMSSKYMEDGKEKKLTKKQADWFQKQVDNGANKGYRTLALAYKKKEDKTLDEGDLKNLVLVAIVYISDPIRRDVADTIKKARRAGIHVVMITGDHMRTARAIAAELHLPHEEKRIMNGDELANLSDEELQKKLKYITVFARVEPGQKIQIVRAFQANGEVVAMTGDGINDAPAIKGADIGIALGSGTDVAKETSDMVLLDDSFTTIVDAIEEGRHIYQNIKKVILYLLAGSFAEVVLITGSIVAGFPLAALPAQILWINIMQDSFPNMALAFDNKEPGTMDEPPRKKDESLIDKKMRIMILLKSILANFALFSIFVYFWKTTGDIALTRTLVFVGFGTDALLFIFSIRSMKKFVWQINPFSNKYLVGAVILGWVLLISAIYFPPFQYVLRTVPLTWSHWVLMLGYGIFNMALIESVKGLFIILRNGKRV
ncbi:MAG: HAD-IC family P-type ATPase [Candidatus Magasanikbacteria bacterium]